jgi:hypothetical protein
MLADWSFGRRFVGAARARTTAEGWVFPSPKRATRAALGRAGKNGGRLGGRSLSRPGHRARRLGCFHLGVGSQVSKTEAGIWAR